MPALSAGKPHRLRFDPKAKTAVILVSGFNGTGLHTLFSVKKVFGEVFRNWFFIQAGIVDADRFKGAEGHRPAAHPRGEGPGPLRAVPEGGRHVRPGLFRRSARMSPTRSAVSRSPSTRSTPRAVFFGGQIVFVEDSFLTRLLFNHTTFAVQRRLHQLGIPFLVMPVRVQ